MNPISWLRNRLIPPASLSVDADGVNYRPFMCRFKTIRWPELEEVAIETTDNGPFGEDFFAVLRTAEFTARIPQEVLGFEDLLARLQQLPGFNNEAVIEAAGSTEDATFLCWKRGGS